MCDSLAAADRVESSGQYRLRALIVEKRSIPRTAGEFAIGELVGLAGSHQIAFVSIEDARRLVTWTAAMWDMTSSHSKNAVSA